MYSKDFKDIASGLAVTAVGGFTIVYAATHYRIGSLSQLGPGGFPLGLGIALAVLGLMILIPAFFRPGKTVVLRWRVPIIITGSIALFALVVGPFGLFPAIIALVATASIANRPYLPVVVGLSCLVLCTLSYLIFKVGLALPLEFLKWPF